MQKEYNRQCRNVILRDYQKQLGANEKDKLEEMDKFFKKYNLPRLNMEKEKLWIGQSQH